MVILADPSGLILDCDDSEVGSGEGSDETRDVLATAMRE